MYSRTYVQLPPFGPLLTSGRCSEVALPIKTETLTPKMVVAVGSWSLFGGVR